MPETDQAAKRKPTSTEGYQLFVAANEGGARRVRELAAAGVKIDDDLPHMPGMTTLMLACMQGRRDTVEALLEAGVDVNRRNKDGWSALFFASNGSHQVARLLVEHSADVNVRSRVTGLDGETPLMRAASGGNRHMIRVLLEAGADRAARDEQGATALHHATTFPEKVEAVKELLAAGGEVDAADERGRTPLMLAAQNGFVKTCRTLLKAGANALARDGEGHTARDLALARGHAESADLLAQAERGGIGPKGKTAPDPKAEPLKALRTAVEAGDAAGVRRLLGEDANSNARFSNCQTALMLAAKKGDPDVARVLLEAGADVRARDKTGGTALLNASGLPVVRALVEAGADVNDYADAYDPPTPLLGAVGTGDLERVRFLLAAGANPNFPAGPTIEAAWDDVEGEEDEADEDAEPYASPLVFAASLGYREIARALMEAGAAADEVTGPFLHLLDFAENAEQPAYRALVARLTELVGRDPTPARELPGALLFDVEDVESLGARFGAGATLQQVWAEDADRERRIESILALVQDEVRAAGYHLIQTAYYHMAGRPETLLLLPTPDKYAVIAAAGTNGNGYNSTPEIIAWLKRMERDQPWVLTRCSHDTIAGRCTTPVKDPEALAERMVSFCSDLEDPEAVADALRTSGEIFFWWD